MNWLTAEYADDLFAFTVDWNGGHPGFVEGCANCGTPLEVLEGQRRIGGHFFHQEPDLFCDDCVARVRPDLVARGAR